MLLRDSDVARRIRTYLLNMEYLARTPPMEEPAPNDALSLDDRIDRRITHILGKTVVPMFNALIETSGEHRLFVATTSFTPDARAIAESYDVTLVDRAHLEKWSAGVPLPILQ
jgi:hypothetical protein